MSEETNLQPPDGIANEFVDAPKDAGQQTGQQVFRGVGKSGWSEVPVGVCVEVLKRRQVADGKWEIVQTIGGQGTWSFCLMTAKPTSTIKRGRFDAPSREPHPCFTAFNSCDPVRAQKLPIILISPREEDCWGSNLGMFMAPDGKKVGSGWFCRGDGTNAARWNGKAHTPIQCPDTMCEYRLSNPPKCKPHTRLFGQLNWSSESPLPRWTFSWQSQSIHAASNLRGLFEQVRRTAFGILHPDKVATVVDAAQMPPFPLIGLELVLTVSETTKPGKRFPEVQVTPAVDSLGGWVVKMIGSMKTSRDSLPQGGCQMPVLPPQRVIPALPGGVTQQEWDETAEGLLNPSVYKPANER